MQASIYFMILKVPKREEGKKKAAAHIPNAVSGHQG